LLFPHIRGRTDRNNRANKGVWGKRCEGAAAQKRRLFFCLGIKAVSDTKARLVIEGVVLLLVFLFIQGEITSIENKIDALPQRIVEAEAEHKRAQVWLNEHYPNGTPADQALDAVKRDGGKWGDQKNSDIAWGRLSGSPFAILNSNVSPRRCRSSNISLPLICVETIHQIMATIAAS
jgi:hypothetical protein